MQGKVEEREENGGEKEEKVTMGGGCKKKGVGGMGMEFSMKAGF